VSVRTVLIVRIAPTLRHRMWSMPLGSKRICGGGFLGRAATLLGAAVNGWPSAPSALDQRCRGGMWSISSAL